MLHQMLHRQQGMYINTILAVKKEKIKKAFSALGIVSLLTAPLIIGYLLSISSSIFFYKCYIKELTIDEYVTLIQNEYKNRNKKE